MRIVHQAVHGITEQERSSCPNDPFESESIVFLCSLLLCRQDVLVPELDLVRQKSTCGTDDLDIDRFRDLPCFDEKTCALAE